jgi:TolB-like protein
MSTKPSFFAELKRRNVLRAAVLYAGAVWALAQGISQLGPAFGAADWVTRWFVIAAIIGFPFWLAFAWFYEFTPQGLKRESEVVPDAAVAYSTARKLDFAIIAVLAIAVVSLLTNTFIWHKGAGFDAAANAAAIPAKSIAVLPFVNLSGDAENDYFSDGITEEILNALAQIPDLKVAARTSAFAFKGKREDLRKVGEVLDVATVLEGSVQRAGDEVRITAQLIDTRSGYHLWSEKYDRKLTSIFAVEDEISKAIADKLRVQLKGGGGQPLVAVGTKNPQAHDLYLRGLTLLAARGSGLRDAVDAFQQAVQLDPGYAQAWGALAETETLLPAYGVDTLAAVLPRAESAARRAIMLDPATPLAHVALGNVYGDRWQWADADQAFRRALALAPGDVETIDQYAQFLFVAGQFDAALREIERAQQLNPLSAVIGVNRTQFLIALHRFDEAGTQIRQTLATHPDFALAHVFAAALDIDRHRYPQAEAQMRLAAPLSGGDPDAFMLLVRGMADPALRAKVVGELETSPAYAALRLDPIIHAMYLTWLGETDRALDVLELFAVKRNSNQPQTLWSPAFDPIRNDPRFKAVLKKMGLPYKPTESDSP